MKYTPSSFTSKNNSENFDFKMTVSFSNKTMITTRSASFPPKSYPIVHKIEDELKKLAKSEELCTSELETISVGLSGVARMYKFVDEALKLRSAQHTLHVAGYVYPLVAATTKLVDVCCTSKQMMQTLRKEVFNVHATLQTNNCDSIADSDRLSAYLCTRKETMSSATASVRQLEAEAMRNLGKYEVSEVCRVLSSVSIINVSVLEALFRVLMTKPAKRGMFCRLGLTKKTRGKAATLPGKYGNKLSDVDVAVQAVFTLQKGVDINVDTLAVALKRLESMEASLVELEDGVEVIISVLSKIRASLHKIDH